ncbi:PAS domain S-box protein [Ectobacillus ponti]|uniref:histidine kinase n=1 Tax=Ectobacillus ponti TaxID=2961894 RepID=A0AA41X8T5_9BACI|nr:PAS domain S-box protein [Ectobacillus ponti]MCP8968990.1 PAS domain S-box protein [Ectobacillus ponti]
MKTPAVDAHEMLDRIQDAFLALDCQGNCTYINAEASRLLSRSREEWMGRHIREMFPEASFHECYKAAMEKQQPGVYSGFFPPLQAWLYIRMHPSPDGLSIYFWDVTKEQAAMSEREGHYQSLFIHNPDAICCFDLHGNYMNANTAMEQLLGYSREELQQLSFIRLVSQGDVEKAKRHYRLAAGGTTQRYEMRVIHKDGSLVHADMINIPILVNGKVAGVYGIAKNITDRKLAEQELRKTKESLQSLVRNNADAIWIMDMEEQVVEVNETFEAMYQWSAAEVIGKELPTIPDSAKETEGEMRRRVKAGGRIVDLETIRQRRDGSLLNISATLSPILNEAGTVIGITGICRDITPRKRAEASLKARTQQLESFIENNADAILVLDLQGTILQVNPAFERIFGWRKEEMVGIHLHKLPTIPPEQEEEMKDLEASVREGHLLSGVETRRMRKDGTLLDVILTLSPIQDEKGDIDGWSASIRDITEWKKSQLLLQNTEKLSVAGQLAAGIAHEIRNPITAIKGFIQLIRSGLGEREEYFDIMVSEIERIEQILSELLLLAKPQAAKFERKDIKVLLAQVITLLDTQAILNNVEIVTQFQPGFTYISCDENQLKQVFINYIKNAIEAMPRGGRLVIQVKRLGPDQISICFIDQGVGMSEEVLAKLGQPFYTTKENGTGLGFMISKKIIENHSGEVHITSKHQHGTTIEVQLPLHQE